MWENEFSGVCVEAEEAPGPGWKLVENPDVILSLTERAAPGTIKIVELLGEMLVEARRGLETPQMASIEAIALHTKAAQAKISLLKEILWRLGKV